MLPVSVPVLECRCGWVSEMLLLFRAYSRIFVNDAALGLKHKRNHVREILDAESPPTHAELGECQPHPQASDDPHGRPRPLGRAFLCLSVGL